MNTTIAILKPDAVVRGLAQTIRTEIYARGLWIKAEGMVWAAPLPMIAEFYREHEGRPYFAGLCAFMTSGPLQALELAGPMERDVVAAWRALMGPSAPEKRGADTIRGRFALGFPEMENLVHGSDSVAAASREALILRTWGFL